MIQRIQTIWLFLAALCFFSLFFLPFGFGQSTESSNGMIVYMPFKATGNTLLLLLTIVSGVLAIAAIFMYQRRLLQIKICWASMFAGLAIGVYASWKFYTDFAGAGLGLGLVMPLVGANFLFFAIRGIRKDENLIKSADRLR